MMEVDSPARASTLENPALGRNGRPTLKTISEITGLGVTTVSRALKGAPELSAETRARVQEVAEQIGYRPDRAGVRLRTGRTYVIGLILDQSVTIAEFERRIILGISRILASTNYHLVVTPLPQGANIIEPVRYFVESGAADGLIFTHTQPADERVRYLLDRRFPFITHGRTNLGEDHPYYDFDNERFIADAARRLIARGRRRLALIGPPDNMTCSLHMLDGFHKVISQGKAEGHVERRVDLDSDPTEFRQAAYAMASGPNPPDGIICAHETRSIAIMAGLRDAGLTVGRDVDVIAKDTSDLLDFVTPAIDSFYEDMTFAGEELARLLLKRIHGAPVSELQTIAEPLFHGRADASS